MAKITQYLKERAIKTVKNSMTETWSYIEGETNYVVVKEGTDPPPHELFLGVISVNEVKYFIYQLKI